MTISSATRKAGPFLGNGATATFPFTFKVFQASDLKVVKTSVSGTDAVLTLSSDYSVALNADQNNNPGGSVTYPISGTLLQTGEKVTVITALPALQGTHITNGGNFFANNIEDEFDYLTILLQQCVEQLSRAVLVPTSDVNPFQSLPGAAIRGAGQGTFPHFAAGNGNVELVTGISGLVALSSSIIGTTLNSLKQTAAEVSASITPSDYAYLPGDVRRYGALLNGSADDTIAFQRASLVSLQPYAPAGSTVITGTIQIRANQHWRLDRTNINVVGGLIVVFNVAEGVNNWSMGGSWSITGDGPSDGSGGGGAVGLWITDSAHWRVEGFTGNNIKGWGILVSAGVSVANRGESGQIIAPQAYGCSVGLEVQAGASGGAEFVSLISPNVARCGIGLKLGAGNVNSTGGNATVCAIGVWIDQGPNSAHGIVSGMNINHSTAFGVQTNQVLNGFTFVGCHFYQNNLFFDRSSGILLEGGVIDCGVYNFKDGSSGVNVIRNMYCPGGYGFIRQAGGNNGHDQLIIENCFGPGIISSAGDALDPVGLSMNDVSPMHLFYRRDPTSLQAVTSGVSADLLFNNKIFDRRSAYNAATGVFTVPTGKAGMYRVRATCMFGGTAMSSTASFVELKVNGTTTRIALTEIFSTTKLRCTVEEEIYLNAADAVKLSATITGTTPSFGDATWQSYFSVEKIA